MYRMAMITMVAPKSISQRLDMNKCIRMCLVHDMAESLVGDITPRDKVDKPEKSRRESLTAEYMGKALLGKFEGGTVGQEIIDVWREYEDGQTDESKFVHDVDKVELLLQALEYEERGKGDIDLSDFMGKSIQTPEMQEWVEEIMSGRSRYRKDD